MKKSLKRLCEKGKGMRITIVVGTRPETLEVGSSVLAGCNPTEIIKSVDLMLNKEANWKNPYGDGIAGEQIVEILEALE